MKKVILEIMQNGYAGGPLRVSWLDVSYFTGPEVSEIIACNTIPDKDQWCRIKCPGCDDIKYPEEIRKSQMDSALKIWKKNEIEKVMKTVSLKGGE